MQRFGEGAIARFRVRLIEESGGVALMRPPTEAASGGLGCRWYMRRLRRDFWYFLHRGAKRLDVFVWTSRHHGLGQLLELGRPDCNLIVTTLLSIGISAESNIDIANRPFRCRDSG